MIKSLRTPLGLLLVAALALAGMSGLVQVLPHLTHAPVSAILLREAVLIVASIALLAALTRAGTVPPATMGLRRPAMSTLGWGVAAAFASLLISVAMLVVMSTLGIQQNSKVLAAVGHLPALLLVLIALTAAISEEIVFRAVALTHIAAASGRVWIGAAVSLAAFALAHQSGWGWSQVLFAAAPGLVLTLFFVWKRDLGICVIAHFLTDLVGLLGAAAQVHHG